MYANFPVYPSDSPKNPLIKEMSVVTYLLSIYVLEHGPYQPIRKTCHGDQKQKKKHKKTHCELFLNAAALA